MKSAQPLTSGRGATKAAPFPSAGPGAAAPPSRRARPAGVQSDARSQREPSARVPPLVAPKLTKLIQTKIVVPRGPSTDPQAVQRERLVAAVLSAQSRPAVTQAVDALLAAGHALPEDQELHLQVLEHADEGRVRASIDALAAILGREPAKRRPVLEQRLKRLELFAEEPATREAATALRRKL